QTRKVAGSAQRVKPVTVESRCTARPVAAIVAERFAVRSGPNFFSVGNVKRDDEFTVAAQSHRIQTAPGNCERRIASARARSFPNQRRPAFGPLLKQTRFFRDAVAICSAP